MKYIVFGFLLETVAAQAAITTPETAEDLFWYWAGLIALAIVGVIILFVSSEQLRRLKRVYDQILEKEKRLEESQSKFLDDLGENIYETLQATTRTTNEVIEKAKELVPESQIEKIREGEQQLLTSTKDLIFFLKLKSKRVKILPGDFELRQLMEDISEVLQSKYGDKGHRFGLEIDDALPKVLYGDSLRLGQIIVNLVGNAVEEVSEPVEIHIDVHSAKLGEPKREGIAISIRDANEENVHPAFQNFEPYYDDERKEFVGLRLFVARELVALMGGILKTEQRKGSHEVRLFLPISAPEDQGEFLQELPLACIPQRVLIYDERGEEVEVMQRVFAHYCCPVSYFDSEVCGETIPNFSLYELVFIADEYFGPLQQKMLEALRKTENLKVVLITNHKEQIERRDLIDAYLTRPLSSNEVSIVLSKLFDEMYSEAESDDRAPEPNHPEYKDVLEAKKAVSPPSFVGNVTVVEHDREPKEEATVEAVEDRAQSVGEEEIHSLYLPPTVPGITRKSFAPLRGHILLAEDNRINQRVIQDLLKNSGIELTIVSDGYEALEAIESPEKSFDLVLLDTGLPMMTGEEVARIVRQNPEHEMLPLVAFTATPYGDVREKYREIGFDAFLPKPFQVSQLYNLLLRYLDNEAIPTPSSFQRVQDAVLDEEKGLTFANEKKELYQELLKEFLSVYAPSWSLLEKYRREGSLDQARNFLLDIRGLSATIGAEALYRLVDRLFRKVGEAKEPLSEEDVEAYGRELERLKAAVERYLLKQV
ncbi:ATP-binding response regulator [Nitratifractor sp.]